MFKQIFNSGAECFPVVKVSFTVDKPFHGDARKEEDDVDVFHSVVPLNMRNDSRTHESTPPRHLYGGGRTSEDPVDEVPVGTTRRRSQCPDSLT